MKQIVGLYVAWLIAVVMLALAVVGPPSINFGPRTSSYLSARASRSHSHGRGYYRQRNDFYTLLRWVCCAAFAYSAFTAFQMKRVAWTWIHARPMAVVDCLFLIQEHGRNTGTLVHSPAVYGEAGNVIETHEHAGDFKEP